MKIHALTRRRLRRFAVALIIAAILLTLYNLAAEWTISQRFGPDITQFRRSRPAAYASSPFYSLDFIDEQTGLSESWHPGETFSGWDSNFHGHYFNTDHGIRRTAFQPVTAIHTVWMLGNSTLFDYEVPDDLTISSQLQKRFNSVYGPHFRVVNLGQTGLGVVENVALLKKLPLQRGDIVIQYDGLSEAFALRLSETNRRGASGAGSVCNWLASGPIGGWGLVKLYCLLVDETSPVSTVQPAQPTVDRTARLFEDNLAEAYRYTASRGADYYHFMPPHIWSKPPSAYERLILKDPFLTPPGTEQSFQLMWPALQAAQARVAGQGIRSYDLTHLLDQRRSQGQEFFLDFVHVTEVGDELIAQAMFEAIGRI